MFAADAELSNFAKKVSDDLSQPPSSLCVLGKDLFRSLLESLGQSSKDTSEKVQAVIGNHCIIQVISCAVSFWSIVSLACRTAANLWKFTQR